MKEWNEHIEEYLNGELTASDAKAFEKELITNSDLQAELALGKLMIEAVDKTGEIDLRNYLQKNTAVIASRAAKAGTIKYMWAAASVAAILVCGVFVYNVYNSPSPAKIKKESYFGFEEDIEESEEKGKIANNEKPKEENIQYDELEELPIDSFEYIANADDVSISLLLPPSRRTVLARSEIIPIEIFESVIEEAPNEKKDEPIVSYDYSNNQGRAVEKIRKKKEASGSKKLEEADTVIIIDKNKTKWADVKKPKPIKKYNFKVSYYENENDSIMLSNSIKDNETIHLEVDNLSPDDAVILLYNNHYYLKSENDFYLIDLNQTNTEKAKVIDKRLIKNLTGELE